LATDRPTLADAAFKTDERERDNATGPAGPIKAWQRISKQPWVAHLLRMFARFTERLGNQFAAAITYFSFLSLVPILMVGFATAGFVLASQPQLIQSLKDEIGTIFASSGGDSAANLNALIDHAIAARFSLGIVALVIALYTGIGWMTNIRQAVGAQWRPKWEEDPADVDNIVLATAKDLLSLVVLAVGILVSVTLTTVASAATGAITGWLGVDDIGWLTAGLRIVPIVLAIAASTLMFFFIYSFLPRPKGIAPRRKLWRGAVFAATVFEILKLVLSLLIQQFSNSATAAVFGSVIALLLFMNLVARLLLMVAAWIATSEIVEDEPASEPAVVIRPQYRVHSVPALVGGLGVGAAAGWMIRRFRGSQS
jgi:membrane protein